MGQSGGSPHLDEVFMGHTRVGVETAGDHLFREQGVLGEKGSRDQGPGV